MLDQAPAPPAAGVRRATGRFPLFAAPGLHAARRDPRSAVPLERISPPGDSEPSLWHAARDERLLAWLRLAGASVLLLSLVMDAGPYHPGAVQALVIFYLCYSSVIVVASASGSPWLLRHVNVIHGIDFAWTAAASTISGGTGSHIFPFFAFLLAAAAFRWGLARTLLDGALILTIAVTQSAAAAAGLTPWRFNFDPFLLHVSFVVLGIAVLFGVIADRLHLARRHALAVAGLVTGLSRAPRLSGAIAETLATLARLMRARHVLLVVEEVYTGTFWLWRAEATDGGMTTVRTELASGAASDWVPPTAGALCPCELRRRDRHANAEVAIANAADAAAADAWLPLPRGVRTVTPWRTLLAVPFNAAGAWRGQCYVMDPSGRPGGELRLRYLADIVRQTTPGLLNLYLLRRLRSRAESLERGRISRELHDTVHQSLAGVEMRIDVLRRQAGAASPAFADELANIQRVLRSEALDLRQLMDRLRSVEVDARRLPGALGDLVARFSQATDIEARLEWTVSQLNLPPHHCSEILRIVQEALFNVRRHSGAGRVVVRIEADADGWGLIVVDNGHGLGFTGRLSGDELEVERKGPRVIRERVAALGGSLAVESSVGGTRLEITFPRMERR